MSESSLRDIPLLFPSRLLSFFLIYFRIKRLIFVLFLLPFFVTSSIQLNTLIEINIVKYVVGTTLRHPSQVKGNSFGGIWKKLQNFQSKLKFFTQIVLFLFLVEIHMQ